jgi:hypothetical protein
VNEDEILQWLCGRTIADVVRVTDHGWRRSRREDADTVTLVFDDGSAVEVQSVGRRMTLTHVPDFEGELAAIEIVVE